MPVYTNTISSQNTAASGGVNEYPKLSQVVYGSIVQDQFQRSALNPTGAIAYYSTGGVGTPNIVLGSNRSLAVNTSAAANDNSAVVCNGAPFARQAYYIDTRSSITFDIIFYANTITSQQLFIGFNDTSVILTAMPTNANYTLGLWHDTSVSNNWKIVQSNGTTQILTDTSLAATAFEVERLNIIWNGYDSATINFYTSGSTNTKVIPTWTLQKSVQVTSLGNNALSIDTNLYLTIFNQTLTTSASNTTFLEWRAIIT